MILKCDLILIEAHDNSKLWKKIIIEWEVYISFVFCVIAIGATSFVLRRRTILIYNLSFIGLYLMNII